MRSLATGLAVLVATGIVAGCDDPTNNRTSRDAQVYVATIRDVLADQPPPPKPDVLPVVYVVGDGETKIPADVQAEVAADLDDDAEIRFADERVEALLEDEQHRPVRDDGVLMVVGALPTEAGPIDVDVEVYRSDADWSRLVLTVARGSSDWTVTSTSVLPVDDS